MSVKGIPFRLNSCRTILRKVEIPFLLPHRGLLQGWGSSEEKGGVFFELGIPLFFVSSGKWGLFLFPRRARPKSEGESFFGTSSTELVFLVEDESASPRRGSR